MDQPPTSSLHTSHLWLPSDTDHSRRPELAQERARLPAGVIQRSQHSMALGRESTVFLHILCEETHILRTFIKEVPL
jgi:hypothetical protein